MEKFCLLAIPLFISSVNAFFPYSIPADNHLSYGVNEDPFNSGPFSSYPSITYNAHRKSRGKAHFRQGQAPTSPAYTDTNRNRGIVIKDIELSEWSQPDLRGKKPKSSFGTRRKLSSNLLNPLPQPIPFGSAERLTTSFNGAIHPLEHLNNDSNVFFIPPNYYEETFGIDKPRSELMSIRKNERNALVYGVYGVETADQVKAFQYVKSTVCHNLSDSTGMSKMLTTINHKIGRYSWSLPTTFEKYLGLPNNRHHPKHTWVHAATCLERDVLKANGASVDNIGDIHALDSTYLSRFLQYTDTWLIFSIRRHASVSNSTTTDDERPYRVTILRGQFQDTILEISVLPDGAMRIDALSNFDGIAFFNRDVSLITRFKLPSDGSWMHFGFTLINRQHEKRKWALVKLAQVPLTDGQASTSRLAHNQFKMDKLIAAAAWNYLTENPYFINFDIGSKVDFVQKVPLLKLYKSKNVGDRQFVDMQRAGLYKIPEWTDNLVVNGHPAAETHVSINRYAKWEDLTVDLSSASKELGTIQQIGFAKCFLKTGWSFRDLNGVASYNQFLLC